MPFYNLKKCKFILTINYFHLFLFLSVAAWVGSVGLAMLWFASLLAGYLCDRFGCRITCFVGGVVCMTGLMSTSFVNSLTLMYVTYSLVYGLGASFSFNSLYLIVGKYFNQKLSLAIGITALGASIGVLYTGPLLQVLLDSFGWRKTFRIMSATFALVCILSLNFNPNVEETTVVEDFDPKTYNIKQEVGIKSRISFNCSVWSFPVYTFVVISLVVGSFGLFIPLISLVSIHLFIVQQTFCRSQSIPKHSTTALPVPKLVKNIQAFYLCPGWGGGGGSQIEIKGVIIEPFGG